MMEQIKFRYCYTDGKDWGFKCFTLEEVENNAPFIFLNLNPVLASYKLTTRDRFTGLQTEKGTEVFGGDIIKTSKNTVVVFFGTKKYDVVMNGTKDVIEVTGWLVKNKMGQVETLDSSFLKGDIIGNIHDNPELLTDKK